LIYLGAQGTFRGRLPAMPFVQSPKDLDGQARPRSHPLTLPPHTLLLTTLGLRVHSKAQRLRSQDLAAKSPPTPRPRRCFVHGHSRRELTPLRGTVAHLGNQGWCVHIHTGNLSPHIRVFSRPSGGPFFGSLPSARLLLPPPQINPRVQPENCRKDLLRINLG